MLKKLTDGNLSDFEILVIGTKWSLRLDFLKITSWDRSKSAPRSSFLNIQRTLVFLKLLSLSQCRKISQRVRIIFENHIFPNWKQKIHFWKKISFFSKKFHRAEKGTFLELHFLKPKSAMKAGGCPLAK